MDQSGGEQSKAAVSETQHPGPVRRWSDLPACPIASGFDCLLHLLYDIYTLCLDNNIVLFNLISTNINIRTTGLSPMEAGQQYSGNNTVLYGNIPRSAP